MPTRRDRAWSEAQRDLSISLNNLGDVAVAAGDLPGAKARCEEDLAITRKLAKDTSTSAKASTSSCPMLGGTAVPARQRPATPTKNTPPMSSR